MLAPESDIKLTRPNVFAFPCPTSWRPEQLTKIGMTKLRHGYGHRMYFIIGSVGAG